MATNEQELQTEIEHIKDHGYDVKPYFHELFKQMFPDELLQQEGITAVDELLTEDTLKGAMEKKYEKDGYVILFYTHKTHSNMYSTHNNDRNPTHTTLLLCKVTDGKISQTLNMDGYRNLGFMDILGVRNPSVPRNPHIKKCLVIDAPNDVGDRDRTPLQRPSWFNLNCVLYSLSFAKSMLTAFKDMPFIFDEAFDVIFDETFASIYVGDKPPGRGVTPPAVENLRDLIIQGLDEIYVKQQGGVYCRDEHKAKAFHDNVRAQLALTIEEQYHKRKALELDARAHQDKLPGGEELVDTKKDQVVVGGEGPIKVEDKPPVVVVKSAKTDDKVPVVEEEPVHKDKEGGLGREEPVNPVNAHSVDGVDKSVKVEDKVPDVVVKSVDKDAPKGNPVVDKAKNPEVPPEPVIKNKKPTPVSTVSIFKPSPVELPVAVKQLDKLCTNYQAHLYAEIKKLTKHNPKTLIKEHVIDRNNTSPLNVLLNKYAVVNQMMGALNNEEEPNVLNRVQNMKDVLTSTNKEILAEHRSLGGRFLQGVLTILSAIFRQEWKYKTKGEELSDTIVNSTPKNNSPQI